MAPQLRRQETRLSSEEICSSRTKGVAASIEIACARVLWQFTYAQDRQQKNANVNTKTYSFALIGKMLQIVGSSRYKSRRNNIGAPSERFLFRWREVLVFLGSNPQNRYFFDECKRSLFCVSFVVSRDTFVSESELARARNFLRFPANERRVYRRRVWNPANTDAPDLPDHTSPPDLDILPLSSF